MEAEEINIGNSKTSPLSAGLQLSPTKTDLNKVMTKVGKLWNFDVLWFENISDKVAMIEISLYLLEEFNLKSKFRMNEFKVINFFTQIQKVSLSKIQLYQDNPYHNSRHAIDVTSSTLFLLSNSLVLRHLSSIDLLSAIISSVCHDVGHIGFTSRFLV